MYLVIGVDQVTADSYRNLCDAVEQSFIGFCDHLHDTIRRKMASLWSDVNTANGSAKEKVRDLFDNA